jgi:hypothetical protein
MSHPIRNMIMLSATALALIAAPVLTNQTALSDLQAIAKDKGNGGGNSDGGGGGGGGNGNGGGSENSNGGGGGGSNGQSNKSEGKSKKVADTEAVTTTTKAAKVAKTKTLDAQLAGLHSLKRNINGLMNSSSPRMEKMRTFVENSAALETAAAALEVEEALLGELQGELDDVIVAATDEIVPFNTTTVYDAPTLEGLTGRMIEVDAELLANPTNQLAIAEKAALTTALDAINLSPELAAVTEQQGVVEGIEGDIAALEPLTNEDALKAALIAAANKNRVAEAGADAYLTPEIMAWANGVLGVGEEDGLIDDLLAQQ